MDQPTSPSSSSEDAPRPGVFLHIKAALGGVGLFLGLIGMSLHRNTLVWGAVGCLGVAFLFRFVGRK